MPAALEVRDEGFASVFGAGRGAAEHDTVLSTAARPSKRAREDLERLRKDASTSDEGLVRALGVILAHPGSRTRHQLLDSLRQHVENVLGRRALDSFQTPLGVWLDACGALSNGADTVLKSRNGMLHLWRDGHWTELEFALANSEYPPTLMCGREVTNEMHWRHAPRGEWHAPRGEWHAPRGEWRSRPLRCAVCVNHEHETAFEDDCFSRAFLPAWLEDSVSRGLGRELIGHASEDLASVDAHAEAAVYANLLEIALELVAERREKAVQHALGVKGYSELRKHFNSLTLYGLLSDGDWEEHLRAFLPANSSADIDVESMRAALAERLRAKR